MEKKYDWIQIKKDFFDSDFLDVAPFLQQKIGKLPANDGNVAKQVKGWAEEKNLWKRAEIQKVEDETRQVLIDKMKISLEELLAAKKLSYSLMIRYLSFFAKILDGQVLTESEVKFVNSFPVGKVDMITKWLQIELGEPTKREEIKEYEMEKGVEPIISINFQIANIVNSLSEDARRKIVEIIHQAKESK